MLTVIDEYTRACLAIEVARQLRADDVRMSSPICSSRTARRTTSGLTTAASSPPRWSATAWPGVQTL